MPSYINCHTLSRRNYWFIRLVWRSTMILKWSHVCIHSLWNAFVISRWTGSQIHTLVQSAGRNLNFLFEIYYWIRHFNKRSRDTMFVLLIKEIIRWRQSRLPYLIYFFPIVQNIETDPQRLHCIIIPSTWEKILSGLLISETLNK